MVDEPEKADLKSEDAPFDVQYQNAIFQFLFLLVEVYAKELPYNQAVVKACDWLSSLATDVRKKSIDIAQENADVYQKYIQAQNSQDT